jgi:hypothetical protein
MGIGAPEGTAYLLHHMAQAQRPHSRHQWSYWHDGLQIHNDSITLHSIPNVQLRTLDSLTECNWYFQSTVHCLKLKNSHESVSHDDV